MLSPGVSSTWHRCFPPSPIRAPHSLGRKARTGSTRGCFTDADNASPTCVCVGQSPPSASALPPNQPHSRSGRAPAGPSLNPHPCSASLSPAPSVHHSHVLSTEPLAPLAGSLETNLSWKSHRPVPLPQSSQTQATAPWWPCFLISLLTPSAPPLPLP